MSEKTAWRKHSEACGSEDTRRCVHTCSVCGLSACLFVHEFRNGRPPRLFDCVATQLRGMQHEVRVHEVDGAATSRLGPERSTRSRTSHARARVCAGVLFLCVCVLSMCARVYVCVWSVVCVVVCVWRHIDARRNTAAAADHPFTRQPLPVACHCLDYSSNQPTNQPTTIHPSIHSTLNNYYALSTAINTINYYEFYGIQFRCWFGWNAQIGS